MTLVLQRWFPPPTVYGGLVLQRVLPDGRTTPIAERDPPVPQLAIIGPPGPAGAAGAGGAPFEQSFAAAAVWTVNHNLGRSPASVRVLSPGGVEVEVEVVEISLNQLSILFAAPAAGRIVVL